MTIGPSPSDVAGASLGGSAPDWCLGASSHDVAVCVDWRAGVSPSLSSDLSSDRDLGGVSILGVEVPPCLSADLESWRSTHTWRSWNCAFCLIWGN